MTAAVAELCHWTERHEHAREVPEHLFAPAERENKARTFEPIDNTEADVVRALQDKVLGEFARWNVRRYAEHKIADYLATNCVYYELVEKLIECRLSGCDGYRDRGDGSVKHVVAWDYKCNLTRLCPDEAREEQMRIAERYTPPAAEWQRAAPRRQIQYCVLTWPNIAIGELARYKRLMAKHAAGWLKGMPCRAVKGALCAQEDPLAADGSWNLHTNLLLMVEGRFDWSMARQDWYKRTRQLFDDKHRDFQVHFVDVTKGDLTRTLMELCKYSVKHISCKTDGTIDRVATLTQTASTAPPLTDWPVERFIEWWEAGKNFRRTRSYGVLYKVPALERIGAYAGVVWTGRIKFNRQTGEYERTPIDLIPADNSGVSLPATDKSTRATGPPGPPGRAPSNDAGSRIHSCTEIKQS